jgi:hypothetical protein
MKSIVDAITDLQSPGKPVKLGSVRLKSDLPPADKWGLCSIICAEIQAVVVSTLSGSTWVWLRADGSAL